MIDHIGVNVTDYKRAREFYLAALAPIGYKVIHEGEGYCGIGQAEGENAWLGSIWLMAKESITPNHFCFRTNDRATVDAFYKAGLAAGGKDNGAPGVRTDYHENYYAAFILDADGNNVEVVCQKPE